MSAVRASRLAALSALWFPLMGACHELKEADSGDGSAGEGDGALTDCGEGIFVDSSIDCASLGALDASDDSESTTEDGSPVGSETDTDGDGLSDELEEELGSDPANPDTDGDGLPDGVEVALGYDPNESHSQDETGELNDLEWLLSVLGVESEDMPADTDGDGLFDIVEELLGTDPDHADVDEDGLTDLEELVWGTSHSSADTDGDGIDDGVEVNESGTHPLDPDSDNDGYNDGYEWYVAGTDPTDAADVPTAGAPDVAVGCTSVSEQSGSVFTDWESGASATHYTDWLSSLRRGSECHCSVEVASGERVQILGVSVYTPTEAHLGSDWWPTAADDESLAAPMGVLVTAPFADHDGQPNQQGYSGSAAVNLDDHEWMAFNLNSRSADGLWVAEETPTDVSGTWELVVSFANLAKEPMLTCDDLLNVGGAGAGIQFRIDTDPGGYGVAPAALPPADPARCAPGTPGHTRAQLVPGAGGGLRPLALSGAGQVAGAAVSQLEVERWRGADFLRLSLPDGRVAELSPEAQAVALPGAPWPVEAIRFEAGRHSPGTWAPPAVALTHSCAAAAPAMPADSPVRTFSLGWGALETALQEAAGLSLSALLPGTPLDAELSPLRVRLVAPPPQAEEGPSTHHLSLDVAGVGRLRRIHLRPEAPDRWSVDHRWGPVRLRGTVQVAATGLHLKLIGGELGTASSAAAEEVSLATGGTHGAGLSPTSLALAELF